MRITFCEDLDPRDYTLLQRSEADFTRRIKAATTKLYSEQRMTGDEMRDMAQSLAQLLEDMISLEGFSNE